MSHNKTIRLRTTPGDSKNIQIKVDQDFDFLEILSLKISQEDLYKTFCANYGVVVGRVIANKGFGLPNAKVSVFVPISSEDEQNQLITDLYPYKTSVSKNGNIRYNLLLSESTCSINTPVGTFPTKEQVIDNDIVIEIFEKYYKYTTTTNESGDYMIFGVPTGQQTVHMDLDLSDVSIASIRPYDLIDSGVPKELFDSRTEFKSSTNLGELPQIKTGNIGVDVIPFWGDEETCDIGITRVDFDTNSEIIPRSLFMGSTITDVNKESLNKTCNPRNDQGFLANVLPSGGDIKILRVSNIDNNEWFANKNLKPLGLEEYKTEEIDDDGAYAISLPMNLGHMITDEFGNLIPSADPEIGIATKAMYRFAMGINDSKNGRLRRSAKMLFPSLGNRFGGNGGIVRGDSRIGTEDQRFTDNIFEYADSDNVLDDTSYETINKDFHTFEWKQVYSIAQYIKKYKKGANKFSFLGFKGVDSSNSEFNEMPFTTGIWDPNIVYILFALLQGIVYFLHSLIITLIFLRIGFCWSIKVSTLLRSCNCFAIRPLGWLTVIYGKIRKDNDFDSEVESGPCCGGDCGDDKGVIFSCGDSKYCINMTKLKEEDKGDIGNDACGGYGNKCRTKSKRCSIDACTWYNTFATESEKRYLKGSNPNFYDDDGNIRTEACEFLEVLLLTQNPDFRFQKCAINSDGRSTAKDCWDGVGSHFRFGGLPPNDSLAKALEVLEGWQCCTINLLIEKEEVIKRCFINSWMVGTSYFFKFKYKERLSGDKPNGKEKFCGPGADNRASDRYRLQSCCFGDNDCDDCLIRGYNESRDVNSQIKPYHITNHNIAANNGDLGSSDLNSLIYCNTMFPTKIVNLGSIEMCEDVLNDINKCILDTDCGLDIYNKENNTKEKGWDPITWTTVIDGSSYQSPVAVQEYLLGLSDACLLPVTLFRNDLAAQVAAVATGGIVGGLTALYTALKNKCHEQELKSEKSDGYPQGFYQQISKVNNEIVLTTEDSPCYWDQTCVIGDFRPDMPVEYEDANNTVVSERGGFVFDNDMGQKFHPCGGGTESQGVGGTSSVTYNCNTPTYIITGNNLLFNNWSGTDWITPRNDVDSDNSLEYRNNIKNTPYFYFGLIKGKTAMDKLKSKFFVKK